MTLRSWHHSVRAHGVTGAWRSSGTMPAAPPRAGSSGLAFWLLIVFTFILLLAPQAFVPALIPLRPALVVAIAAIAAHVYTELRQRRPLNLQTREMRITGGLVLWAIVTIPFSYWPGGSVDFLLGSYFKTVAIFWLVSVTAATLTRLRKLAWALSVMAIPLAWAGVGAYSSGQLVGGRISGFDAPLTANPNDLALVLNLILPLMVALFMIHRGLVARTVLLAAMALSVIAVISTFSRGGFLTLVTIGAMYVWVLTKRARAGAMLAALMAFLLGVFLLPSSYLERLGTITHIEADPTGSAQNRWNDMVVGLNLVLQNPIVGSGVGMNVLALNEHRGQTWAPMHNVFLEYAVELGLPGLVLFVMLLVAVLKSARLVEHRSERIPRLRELFHIVQGVRISLVAFTMAAMFHPVGYQPYFYYFGGLAIALRTVFFSEPEAQPSPAPAGGRRSWSSTGRGAPPAL